MVKKEKEENIQKFTKEQFLQSPLAPPSRDLLNVLLEDEKEYTQQEVTEKIEKYRKGKVN